MIVAGTPATAFELSEARVGINVTGVELWTGFRPYDNYTQYEAIDTVEVQLLFRLEGDSVLSYLGDPAISLGVQGSTLGRASLAHLGLNWGTNLGDTPFFIDGTAGLALTNSTLTGARLPDRNVGCPALLYFSADVGYEITENLSIMGTVYHASHASLCWLVDPDAPNNGLNGYGIKVGYKF